MGLWLVRLFSFLDLGGWDVWVRGKSWGWGEKMESVFD